MTGGKREGAGRKRTVEGEVLTTVAFGIAQRHVEAIKQWQVTRDCRSASEAVRQIIDAIHIVSEDAAWPAPGSRIVLEVNAENPICEACGLKELFGPHDHTPKSLENPIDETAVLPAGGENSPDWQWKREPISRPTRESRPKRSKPNSKSKGV